MKQPIDLSPDSLRDLALKNLTEVANDSQAPAAARASAARTLLEAIGVIGRLQDTRKLDDNRSTTEMSPADIADEIARLSTKIPPPYMKRVKTPSPK